MSNNIIDFRARQKRPDAVKPTSAAPKEEKPVRTTAFAAAGFRAPSDKAPKTLDDAAIEVVKTLAFYAHSGQDDGKKAQRALALMQTLWHTVSTQATVKQ